MTQIAKKKATLKTHASQNFDELIGNESLVYLVPKRTLDIIGSLIGIILLSIVFILVAFAIKIEDPKGPVFFSQERIGKKGKIFKMYKFRSMVTDAETKLAELLQLNETTGAMFKMKNDPRVTRIGRLIRKTSVDELPQLFNVLKGEMSLVGPRPPLPREVAEYTNYDKKRLIVTPGCTGIWQVSGRSNIGFKEMVELDLYYIKNQSIFMDVKIIFKTIVLLFGSKNAF
ncbi:MULTISPECIES: sugar transferase [Priestia]